jgi:hypothetical protein
MALLPGGGLPIRRRNNRYIPNHLRSLPETLQLQFRTSAG